MASQLGPRSIFLLLLAICGLMLLLYTTFLQETRDTAPMKLDKKSTKMPLDSTNSLLSFRDTGNTASVRQTEKSIKISQDSTNSLHTFPETVNTAPLKQSENSVKIILNPTNTSDSLHDTAPVRQNEHSIKIPQDLTNASKSLRDSLTAPVRQNENSTKIPQDLTNSNSLRDALAAPVRQRENSTEIHRSSSNLLHSFKNTQNTAPLGQDENSTEIPRNSTNSSNSLKDTHSIAPVRQREKSTKIPWNSTNSSHSLKDSLTAKVRLSKDSSKIPQDSTNSSHSLKETQSTTPVRQSKNSIKIPHNSTNASHSFKDTVPVTQRENSTKIPQDHTNSSNSLRETQSTTPVRQSKNSTKIPQESPKLYNFSRWDSFDADNYPIETKFALLSKLNESSNLDLVNPSVVTNITNTTNTTTSTGGKKIWKVLLWTNFYGAESWYLPMPKKPAPQVLDLTWCPTRCAVTLNRHDPKGHDALMFHGRNGHTPLPTARTPDQLYVFFLLESPIFKGGTSIKGNNFYNWTASYSQRSDVFCPYLRFQPINPHNPQDSAKHINMSQIQNKLHDINVKNSTSKKPGLVAWIVSNCVTPSARQFYTEQLNRYIKVDIYGKCGNLKCPDADCLKMISKTYKFYLAFENSVCEDYVTEKLATALDLGMVPIVLGARRYEQLLPPHSYIDISQFTTVEMLSKYLIHLDKDDKAYMAYHTWRRYYRVNTKDVIARCLCTLCGAMEQGKERQNVNADEFWNNRACDNGLVSRLIGPPRAKT